MKPKKKRGPRNVKTFIPDPDVNEMIEAAVASGATLTDLTNEAIRKFGPGILAQRAKELRQKADALEKKIGEDKR